MKEEKIKSQLLNEKMNTENVKLMSELTNLQNQLAELSPTHKLSDSTFPTSIVLFHIQIK